MKTFMLAFIAGCIISFTMTSCSITVNKTENKAEVINQCEGISNEKYELEYGLGYELNEKN